MWANIVSECEIILETSKSQSVTLKDIFGILTVCAMDVKERYDLLSDIKSICKAIGKAVKTALIIKCAPEGARAVTDLAKIAGLSSKIATATEFFQFAIGVGKILSPITLAAFGVGVDVVSLIFTAYEIHKKSDSRTGKDLIKLRNELKKGRECLNKMHQCLCVTD